MPDKFLDWLMTAGFLTMVGLLIAVHKRLGEYKTEATLQVALAKEKANGLVAESKEKTDKQISRAYERLDEVKEESKQTYVNKDICKILHEQISTSLGEIKTDVKVLLRKNGFKETG